MHRLRLFGFKLVSSLKLLLLLLLLFLGRGTELYGQFYPIYGVVQWPAPQSPYLSDYYSGGRDRLVVTLTNRDLQQPSLSARLRIRLKSTGFLATTREEVVYPILELTSSVPTRLTNVDLIPYLEPQNLLIQGSLRDGKLPTGYTELSVQVVEYYTGRILSAWHTARAYLDVKKPPILNVLEPDAQVSYRDPLYIRFQWMPRHQGMTGTEYEFVLKELPDNGVAPQSAFAYGNEIYRTRTRSTTLNYTHLEPVLLSGRRYAWQVQAIAREGMEEVDLFENGGFSEIGWFTLNDECASPRGLKSKPRYGKVDLSWSSVMGATGYMVQCRPKTSLNIYEWAEVQTTGERTTLAQLKPGWSYEWRVGTLCTSERPVYSEVEEFTLSKHNEELLADCGKEPVRRELKQEPHLGIRVGDVITIGGDYPMLLTEVESLGDGWYSGRGKTRLKTIIDAPIALEFDRLRINVDKYQIGGVVEASYDERKGQVANLDRLDDGGAQIRPATLRLREHRLDFSLPEFPEVAYREATGEIQIIDAEGTPRQIKLDTPRNGDYSSIFPILITDKGGNTYQIEPSPTHGETTGGEIGKSPKGLQARRVSRVGEFDMEVLSKRFGWVRFERGGGRYAFDQGAEKWYQQSVKLDKYYKPFGKGYIAPWKLVPVGETDEVIARYEGNKDIDLKKVLFTSESNTPSVPAELDESTQSWRIRLRSVGANSSYDLYAVYEGEVIGKLRVASYTKQKHRVTIVPLNGYQPDLAELERGLNAIYHPVGVEFSLRLEEGLRGNYSWEVRGEEDRQLSLVGKSFGGGEKELKETEEMRRLHQLYQSLDGVKTEAVVFVLDGAVGLEGLTSQLRGEMPRKSRFGYIFTGNSPNSNTTDAIAYMLAHMMIQPPMVV